ncbi:MAG: tRNA dihydrouridine synthase DusB [Armatimonadetes bacterium]|nr:tRNA dihydrouridine synthase DusB [Armatimonadota bacterium]
MIKSLTDKKIWLAPLAGFTDNAFRKICKQCGADVIVSEMVSADGIVFDKKRSISYTDSDESQRPFGIQLFGSEPKIMAKAVEIILEKKPDFIDVNMGCPVKKVIKRGAGSALMKNPDKAEAIIKEMNNALKGCNVALSAKIRSGWDKQNINAVDFGKMLQNAGVDMICLHPRTRTQMFSGRSDWNLIKELKQKVRIPIIGNGDIRTPEDAQKMFSQTNCDSIMVGRGILGKPWLLTEIKDYLLNAETQTLNLSEKYEIIVQHFEEIVKNKGEQTTIREMRTHFSYYTKGFKGSAKIRNFINKSSDKKKVLSAIQELYS